MNCNDINELVRELAEVIKFHELEEVDYKAAELLIQVNTLFEEIGEVGIVEDTESNEEWIESIRQANLVTTSR